ncbi:MAG: hypothetical protein WC628_01770 [Candidatus Omnitrophota bacterium]
MEKKNKIGVLVLLVIFLVLGNIYAQETAKEVIEKGMEYIR